MKAQVHALQVTVAISAISAALHGTPSPPSSQDSSSHPPPSSHGHTLNGDVRVSVPRSSSAQAKSGTDGELIAAARLPFVGISESNG